MQQLLDSYRTELVHNMEKIDLEQFRKFIDLLVDAYRADKQVFVVGNGGSCATANHFVCDFGKNAVPWDRRRFRIRSLCDNTAVITALGNDISMDAIFSFQLGNQMREGDIVIIISASGNSPDLLSVCDLAKDRKGSIVALSGFSGGKICDKADVVLKSDMYSYERVEDLHMMILHILGITDLHQMAQIPRMRRTFEVFIAAHGASPPL